MRSTLFEPITLRGLTVRNRLWIPPMCQYSAFGEDGVPTDWHLVHYGSLTAGGAGAVMVEASAVVPEGRISHRDLGLWNDEQRDALVRIVDFAHQQGAAIGVQLAHAGAQGLLVGDMVQELGIRQALLAADIVAQLADVAELAFAGGVVHQADDADAVPGAELGHLLGQGLGTDLGAQVQEMADPQRPLGAQAQDLVGQGAGIFAVACIVRRHDRPHAQRVKDGGDAHAGQFGVMGDDRMGMGPVHAGARLDMAFQVVGVQFDQARHQQVALTIQRARGQGAALADLGD